ncbi:hypothetical protein JOM56_013863, partial [Amanita muscaria]
MSLDQSSEEIKFVVQDTQTLDDPTIIASTWSAGSGLSESDDRFSFFCWVLNISNAPFSVDIKKHKTVDNPKRVIKKKVHAFDGIDYNTVNLWRVSECSWCELTRSDIREAISTHP